MNRNIPLALLLLLSLCTAARADESLTADEAKAVVAKEHSKELRVDELKFMTAGRKFVASVKTTDAQGETTELKDIKVSEKWVDGKYIVTTVHLQEGDIHVIVGHDSKAGVYHKWVLLLGGDTLLHSVGVRDGDSKTLSFSGTQTINGAAFHSIGQETHSDKKTTWTELTFMDGKLISKMVGEAKATE